MQKIKHHDKAGVQSGTTHITPMGPQDSSMSSKGPNQKPCPNPSKKVSRGHTLK